MPDPIAPPPPPESLELELLTVAPAGGALAGHVFRMRRPSVRFLIAQRRGRLTDDVAWEEITSAVVEHDLDREPDELPSREVNELGHAWLAALEDAALPPASAAP